MILIDDDKISSVSASSENVNYPKENLFDSDAKKPWRATSTSATLSISVSSGCTCLGLFGVSGPTTATVTYSGSGAPDSETYEITKLLKQVVVYWGSAGVTQVNIALSGGSTVEAAILRAGAGTRLNNPQYGVSNSAIEHSVIHPYKTGGAYVRNRGRSRVMSGSMLLGLADAAALKEVMAEYGPSPLAIVFEGNEIQEYSMFGSLAMSGIPQESRSYPSHVSIGFTATEFI